MTENRNIVLVALFIVVSGLISLTCFPPSATNAQESYVAGLRGYEEVPPVNTSSTGYVNFVLLSDGLSYVLNVTSIYNVTNADIHLASFGKNGPIVGQLFESTTPIVMVNGTLSKGNITADNLQGPIKGQQITDLINHMQEGNIYVNVRTSTNPEGEIRGQIGFQGVDETGTTLGEKKLPPENLEVD
jgi:CHRD domain-containing protein